MLWRKTGHSPASQRTGKGFPGRTSSEVASSGLTGRSEILNGAVPPPDDKTAVPDGSSTRPSEAGQRSRDRRRKTLGKRIGASGTAPRRDPPLKGCPHLAS